MAETPSHSEEPSHRGEYLAPDPSSNFRAQLWWDDGEVWLRSAWWRSAGMIRGGGVSNGLDSCWAIFGMIKYPTGIFGNKIYSNELAIYIYIFFFSLSLSILYYILLYYIIKGLRPLPPTSGHWRFMPVWNWVTNGGWCRRAIWFRRLLFCAFSWQQNILKCMHAKEVSKWNFLQEGQMEKQRWEESEKSREEARRSEKRKGERKDDAGARKGRKVAKHCVLTMICGSGGSKKWACARIRTVTTLTTPHDTTRKDTTRHHTPRGYGSENGQLIPNLWHIGYEHDDI